MSLESLLREVPELLPTAGQVAEERDEEPGLGELLEALADLVINELAPGRDEGATQLVKSEGEGEEKLGRWFGAVEALASDDDDFEAPFLVGSAFLDPLGPETRALVAPWLGPATQAILADLEAGWPEEDHLAWDDE